MNNSNNNGDEENIFEVGCSILHKAETRASWVAFMNYCLIQCQNSEEINIYTDCEEFEREMNLNFTKIYRQIGFSKGKIRLFSKNNEKIYMKALSDNSNTKLKTFMFFIANPSSWNDNDFNKNFFTLMVNTRFAKKHLIISFLENIDLPTSILVNVEYLFFDLCDNMNKHIFQSHFSSYPANAIQIAKEKGSKQVTSFIYKNALAQIPRRIVFEFKEDSVIQIIHIKPNVFCNLTISCSE